MAPTLVATPLFENTWCTALPGGETIVPRRGSLPTR
jgi:hypothetical protein